MKTENTLENKAKFFALYWGQRVLISPDTERNSLIKITHDMMSFTSINEFLQLNPLSKISDEDAIEVAKIVSPLLFLGLGEDNKHYLEKYGSDWFTVKHDKKITSVDIDLDGYVFEYLEDENYTRPAKSYAGTDFLRSKGYALPYMDLSIDDLIEYGWIKLEE